jgi:hypothetical protein
MPSPRSIREGEPVITIQADQIRPGDVVEYHGERHLVCEVQRRQGAAWAVARDGSGWAIALGRQPLRVRRPGLRRAA